MADAKKLDRWAELLLDTGKRNNLINFRDTKTSTAEALLPSSDALFEKLDGPASLEVFDPKIIEEDDEAPESPQDAQDGADEAAAPRGKEAFLAEYSGKIRRQGQILLYNAASPIAAVKNIDKKARAFIEETGVNVAYMAFGFVRWKENDSSGNVFRAPLLLVPIQIERASAMEPYFIKSAEDDIIVNPTFSYKMEAEYGAKLPEYGDEGLSAYLESVSSLVSRLQWEVTAECKMGIFSFLKINMYRDLKDNAEAILKNQNVLHLLGEGEAAPQPEADCSEAAPLKSPLLELHNVVDADSSQIEAIEMARSGRSFVLQGPPGTGKSQTITNIIAELLGCGKRVLFVSEKLAALNVVYEKLRRAGLSEFCLELHSHKASKKDVIADICATLRAERIAVSSKADAEIAAKEKALQQLDAYALELHKMRPVIEKSLYQLYEAHAAFRSMPEIECPLPEISSKGEKYLAETARLLEQYADYVPSVGYDYKKNPWHGFIGQDTSHQGRAEIKAVLSSIIQLLQALIPLQEEIAARHGVQCSSLADARFWQKFFGFAASSKAITPKLLNRANFDAAEAALPALKSISAEILSSRSALSAVFDDDVFKLDGEEYSKKLARQFSGMLSRLFSSEYKKLIADLRLCKRDGKKPSYREACLAAKELSSCQKKSAEYARAEEPVKAFFGEAYGGIETEWNCMDEQISALSSFFSEGFSFCGLESLPDLAPEQAAFADCAQRIESAFALCGNDELERLAACFDAAILNINSAPCDLLLSRLNACLSEIDGLDNWRHFRRLLSDLEERQALGFIDAAIAANIEAGQVSGAFQRQFYFQWIDLILSQEPALSAFNRVSQDNAVRVFSEKDAAQFEINKAKIRSSLSSMRPSLEMLVPGSALAVLLREGEKKRKQKSIRALLAETGELVQRVKPCFLMSPLSVSTFLAPGSVCFDAVIFDEASQIFPQDAVGAIYRAGQLIVVGDSRQMPPSNFFNASAEAEDSDEESGDITDFESILDLCSTSMRQLRLRWHYRSRFESLIAFSNKNFYEGSLVTFPSPKADAQWAGVDYYHVDGIFDRKSHTNRKEAEFVVDLIYQNIEKYPQRSLGVVAFSIAQQDLIDTLLSRRRQSSPENEFFFKNDKDEPFFVKNLETVQGDERDTIIFSIAYGADSQGRLLHNFGPLNRSGGERRLNVAVTRAKCNIQVVSSMHHADIDLKRTSSEGARLLKEYLDYAENGVIALARSLSISPFEQLDSDFELEVCEFLRANGFSVDTQIGCSGFRIDLGLKMPDSSDYVLAIECDGATYHSSKNARDRDRLRQEILERMGWKFYRVWSTDWFKSREREQLRLLEAARNAVKGKAKKAAKRGAAAPAERDAAKAFEEAADKERFEFPPYKAADLNKLGIQNARRNFKTLVKAILEIEAPLSEELLLKRSLCYFGAERLTSSVKLAYAQEMFGCELYGITRRNGFLYLNDGKEIRFRAAGDIKREIRQIAPEELAAGMLEIIRQNVAVDKAAMYRQLAAQCGFARLGKGASEAMDAALSFLEDSIDMEGEQLSLRG